jgi:probable rRNA maturation factor
MMVESHLRMRPSARERFARFLARTQREVGIRGEVHILLTDNAEMQRLNRRFRRKNRPTDVLSFPADNSNGARKTAGDIAISVEIARQNAAVLGHSLDIELKILILHGILHLAGYDHEDDNGEMASLENKLRTKMKLPAGLIHRTVDRSHRKRERP